MRAIFVRERVRKKEKGRGKILVRERVVEEKKTILVRERVVKDRIRCVALVAYI